MAHELTLALRASLPFLLRQRHGRQWHQVVRAQRLQNLDFSAALDIVRDAKPLPAESLVSMQRCHEFRNQLAHQARLSKLRLERGQGVLRDLASALGLPIRAAVAPPPPHLVPSPSESSSAAAALVTPPSLPLLPSPQPLVTGSEPLIDAVIADVRVVQ
jgi:hypothetical protein